MEVFWENSTWFSFKETHHMVSPLRYVKMKMMRFLPSNIFETENISDDAFR